MYQDVPNPGRARAAMAFLFKRLTSRGRRAWESPSGARTVRLDVAVDQPTGAGIEAAANAGVRHTRRRRGQGLSVSRNAVRPYTYLHLEVAPGRRRGRPSRCDDVRVLSAVRCGLMIDAVDVRPVAASGCRDLQSKLPPLRGHTRGTPAPSRFAEAAQQRYAQGIAVQHRRSARPRRRGRAVR